MSVFPSSVSRRTGRASAAAPAVSIVLAVFDPPVNALRTQLAAIAEQTTADWECIVVDDASQRSEVREILDAWCGVADSRILVSRAVNGGIASATNDGLDRATGSIVTICDHDDVIHPTAVERIIEHFAAHPEHDVVYTDEQLIDERGIVIAEYRKPDYSPRRHLGHHYLAHLVAARRSAVGGLRVRRNFEPSQDYDFYLRVIEAARHGNAGVGHIPEILYSWRAVAGSSALAAEEKPEMSTAVERCVNAALERRSIDAVADIVLHRGVPTTSVRLTHDEPTTSSLLLIDYSIDSTPDVINTLVERSDADIVCLVPNGSVADDAWARPLATTAAGADIGVVGPLLVTDSAEPTLLSVGRTVTPSLDDPFAGEAADESGPWGAFLVAREVTAVAPAGMMVTRARFSSVGGLATDVGLDAAVAEMCVQLATSGFATLVDPSVVLRVDSSGLIDAPLRRTIDDDLAIVEQRTPGVREERLDTTGIPSAFLSEPNAYDAARRQLLGGTIQLLTSDVFDTVVTRSVATPSDLFVGLGRQLLDRNMLRQDVTPRLFAEGRRAAERDARKKESDRARGELRAAGHEPHVLEQHPAITSPECTLSEVWEAMPRDWLLTGSTDDYVEREIEFEAASLHPIPATLELFSLACDLSVPVVLVSDIYLSAEQLTRILVDAGVDASMISDVVTSSDHRIGKADGLLDRVITDREIDPANVMHLGDNEVADIDAATTLGAQPIHVDVPNWGRHVPIPSPALVAWSRANGTDLGLSAAIRSSLVDAGPFGRDPSFQFGAAVMAAPLAGFSKWVAARADEFGSGHVHCMLREGATIAEFMSTLAPAGPRPIPVHVSRWVTMRAAVIDASADELLPALARRAALTADHVAEAFGVDRGLVEQALGHDRPDITEACRRIAEHDELRATIVDAAADLRMRVLRHLRATLHTDDGPIVVADVGWGGTIQEGLERILRSDGVTNEVVGLYFALSESGEQRMRRGARMESYLPNGLVDPGVGRVSRSVAHHADTIERIMTPDIGTLIDISPEGEPVCRPTEHDPIPPTLHTAQRAMREMVARLATMPTISDKRWVEDLDLRAAFSRAVADAVNSPKPTLAAAIGEWPHDDVAGTDHRSIAGSDLAAAAPYANARDLDLLDPTGRNWVAGLAAATNPSFSAQLVAADAGASLAALCPDSENGTARLAAFEVGSDLAAVQVGRIPGVTPPGWSLLRITGPVNSLRSIRFDPGEHGAIVDVGHFSITLRTDLVLDPERRTLDDLTDPRLVWVTSHPIDTHHFAHRAGGHLIVPIDPAIAGHVRSVDVTVGFRSWLLDRDESLAETPVAQQVTAHTRRVIDGVKRRFGP